MLANISLNVITKNEEKNLPACLGSAAGLFTEAILVDTGSTDRTREIAASFGARVIDFPWVDDFAAARNECLRHASGAYIFWMDADEALDEQNRQKLAELSANLKGDNAAYVMNCACLGPGQNAPETVVNHVRLFPNHPSIRWQYRIHEQILPALNRFGTAIHWTDIVIQHQGYTDAALLLHKQERNLRLLHLEDRDHPDDPFTLFNLGWTYFTLGRADEALGFLQRSLQLSQPGDSIVHKLYALLAQVHGVLGQGAQALAACRAGLARGPNDLELLYEHGRLLSEQGNIEAARACWHQASEVKPCCQFGSVNVGLRDHARHNLAVLDRQQNHAAEAEEKWRALVSERPDFAAAWLGLTELYLEQRRWQELEQAAAQLAQNPQMAIQAAGLRARAHLARQEFGPCREVLGEIIGRYPLAVWPRVILAHALLQEGKDWPAAERALRAIVEMDPAQAESWCNLAKLLRQQNRLREAEAACRSGRVHCPADPDLLLLHGTMLRELGDLVNAEACLLRILERQPEPAANNGKACERRLLARHHLALIYHEYLRHAEAEVQWRAVLAERPDYLSAWHGLGEIFLAQSRWTELAEMCKRLVNKLRATKEAIAFQARAHLVRKEFAAAQKMLEDAIAVDPKAESLWVLLSYAYLQEGRDWLAAEHALRQVLALNPANAEARRNLEILLRQQAKASA